MKSIFEELYFGNINPNSKQFVRGSDFDRAMQTVVEKENKLIEQLNEKEISVLIDFSNAHSELSSITSKEFFINGFRLGAKIMMEILDEENGCLRDIK